MEDTTSKAQVLLLFNGKPSADGWAEGLINTQTLFDAAADFQITLEKLKQYRILIIPEDSEFSDITAGIIREYVSQGGNLIFEGVKPDKINRILDLTGVKPDIVSSGYLAASYLRFEKDGAALQKGFEETPLFPHRGMVAHCEPEKGNAVLATLVPPFAPLDAVGAPPERASILTPQTDLPLITMNRFGKGKVVFLSFQLSMLACEYKLAEHYHLMRNTVDMLLGEDKLLDMQSINGLQVAVHEKESMLLIHFVNGIGQRPLANNTPYHSLRFSIKLPENYKVSSVHSRIEECKVEYAARDGRLYCELDVLKVWDLIAVEMKAM